MAINSTKSIDMQAKETPKNVKRGSTSPVVEGTELSTSTWRFASAGILALAAIFRFVELAVKPMHHDEGVNGFFLTSLFRNGEYKYDPTNYHGPTLYYLVLPFVYLGGLETVAVRLLTAVSGLITVWLILCLRRSIGTVGALAGAALLAVSPGAVFFSRYFIHETLFVCFTLGAVVAFVWFYNTLKPKYLILVGISAGLTTATKETWVITLGVMIIALLMTHFYVKFGGRKIAAPEGRPAEQKGFGFNVIFYTSFFKNNKGIADAFESVKLWSKRTEEHGHPITTYLNWGLKEEAPILILAVVGALIAVYFARNRFAVFTALWAFGTFAAYSLVGYKTPWLALNFIVPMAITAGYAVDNIYRSKFREYGIWLVLACITVSAYQSTTLNFINYDDDRYPYVYAHTTREYEQMIKDLKRYVDKSGNGLSASIAVTTGEYWPLPWTLRDYTGVGYHGQPVAVEGSTVVITDTDQQEQMKQFLGESFKKVGQYTLRPGVELLMYVPPNLLEGE
jgi:uncharacterized protein (TIGR03663 family)